MTQRPPSINKGEGIFYDYLRLFYNSPHLKPEELQILRRADESGNERAGFAVLRRIARRLPDTPEGRLAAQIVKDETEIMAMVAYGDGVLAVAKGGPVTQADVMALIENLNAVTEGLQQVSENLGQADSAIDSIRSTIGRGQALDRGRLYTLKSHLVNLATSAQGLRYLVDRLL